MDGTRRSYVALAVLVLGMVVASVGAGQAPSRELALALAIGGTAVGFGALIVLYFVYGDEILPSIQPYDERTKRIERYATRNSWFALVILLTAAMFSREYLPAWYRDGLLLPSIVLLGMAVFGVSWSWYEQRM